jgi:RHS repeat-associated protein
VLQGAADASAFGFTGHYVHPATGLALAPFRAYDAEIGKWISRDPIGEAGGVNLYGYVGNNPVNYADSSGLIIDALADLAFILYDLYKLGSEGVCERDANLIALGLDLVGAFTPGATGLGAASRAARGGLNLFKWGKETTTRDVDWKEGDFMLYLPDKGSPRANWKQNAGRIREEMSKGSLIFDSYRDPVTGERIVTGGFLRAERNLLESHGWKYDSSTGAYHPPSN